MDKITNLVRKHVDGGGRKTTSPGVIIKGQAEDIIIEGVIKMWHRDYPEEAFLYECEVKRTRDSLRNKRGMSKEKTMCMEALIPQRIFILLDRLIPDFWDKEGNGTRRFLETYSKAKLKGPK